MVSTRDEFERVFVDHWPRVYRLLVRLVGDPEEAQDLALETFWRYHRRSPHPNQDQNLGAWLGRVATNLGLNALRARKRRSQYEAQSGRDEWLDASAGDPSERVESLAEQERVRAVLARMDPRSAQLLLLRHSGLDYVELAEALDVSPNSIGSLLTRAEREFEKQYSERESSHASG